MGSSQKLCLKWDDFKENIGVSFHQLQKTQEFSDVTLTCDGDNKIEAHKIILSSSSTFFNLLLKKNNHPHPLLYMRGVPTKQLSAVIDFIYHGDVNIHQEDLDDFLKLADELQLKGLSGSERDERDNHMFSDQSFGASTVKTFVKDKNADTDLMKQETNIEDIDATIDTMMENIGRGNGYACKICGKIEPRKRTT